MTSHSGNFSTSSFTSPKASSSWRRECSPSHSPHSPRDGACSSPTMGEASKKSFSSSSLTGHGYYFTYPRVSFNEDLLTPLHLDVDPALQEIKTKEKDDIKMLNNQFAALIGKVQSLEQHNQVLVTRLNFLKEQDNSLSDLDIKLLYDRYMNKLNLEMRSIDAEKEQLDSEIEEVLVSMDSFRQKYEEEINKRTGMEFTFTTLKKDLDNGFLHKTELETKLSGLHAWVELMSTIHEQELEEVMSQVKDVSVVLGIDNNRYIPDPQQIVEDVRAQYEELAMKSWEELEALTRLKLNEREVLCAKYGDHLLNDRRVIAELNIQIQKLRSCIVSLKSQCLHLEDNIKDVGLQGETALNDAKAKLAKLEDVLYNARQDLAQLIKAYQELMNTKLALDIEILTYRKLVEGEEISMESPSPAFISKIYSVPKSFLPDSGITYVPDVASGAKDMTNKMIHSGSSLVTGLSRSHNENGAMTETLAVKAHSETRDNIQEGSDFGSPSHRNAEFLSSKFSRTESGESSNSSGRRYHSRKESVPAGYQSQSQGSREFTENAFARSLSGGISKDSPFRSYSGSSASYIEGWLSRSQSNENECRNVHENEGYAEPVSTTTNAEDDGVLEGGFSGTHNEINSDISQVNLSRSQNDEPESRGSHEEFAEPILSRTRSTEDGGVPVGGISESHSKASRNSSLDGFSKIQRDQSQDSTDTIFSEGHTEGIQESNLHHYSSNTGSNTAYVEGSVSRSLSGEKKSVSKDGGFRTPSIRSTTLSDSVFIRSPTNVDEVVCEETDLKIHSDARESTLESSISGDPSPRSEELSLPELSGLHTTENRGIPDTNPALFVHGRKSQSESGFSINYTDRKGGLTQSVFARPHSVPDKADYPSSVTDGSQGFVKAVVSRLNRSILEGGSSRGQSSRRGGFVDVGLMKDQSQEIKESHGDKRYPDGDARSANETKEGVLPSGRSRIEHEQAGSFSRNLNDSISPVETSTPIQDHRKEEDAAERSFSRSHSGESGSFKAADLLSRSSNEESRDIQEANISTSCDKENEKCTEGMISRNYSYKCAVTSHPGTESNKAEEVLESSLYESHSSESGKLSPSGTYTGQSGERESQSDASRSYSNTDEVAMNNP
ncbi:neurofilament medium polypeptide-like [Ahaetulla prasina]|uniref:neurofilament medium polypeptide-like n=1 Tax=Ahaetulla prasina TaxID=499056 RepID=UPI0026485B6E|nr:neurofilament medium polypeptide-like [Ahaetulla prasina]